MSIRILANTVFKTASVFRVDDNTGTVIPSEQDSSIIATGGPRHLYWQQSLDTNERVFAYINKAGGISYDSLVMTRADKHLGHRFRHVYWSTYPSVGTTVEDDSNWNPTLVGERSQDYVWVGSQVTNTKAATVILGSGTAGAYTRQLYSLYFCQSFLSAATYEVQFSPLPFPTRCQVGPRIFLVDWQWLFRTRLATKADVQALESAYRLRREPLFVYDSTAKMIPYKLLHGMLTDYRATEIGNDVFALDFTIQTLRQYQ